jgi:D-erythrulose 4-phosphate isomerase
LQRGGGDPTFQSSTMKTEETMKIAVAGDSAGADLAHTLADHLKGRFEIDEVSAPRSDAERLYAHLTDRVASQVRDGTYDKAILVCGTGIGVCISANKIPGIRAALTHDTYSAERAALSNNAQIITMGARVIGPELAKSIADAFLAQTFDENGRSAGNVQAIDEIDAKYSKA